MSNNITVKQNFTTSLYLPTMIDTADTDSIMKLGDYTKNSMLLTLVIPFGFMLFMSMSMDSVWAMYLMMQIVSNQQNIIINRPGNTEYLLFIGSQISYFKVTEE